MDQQNFERTCYELEQALLNFGQECQSRYGELWDETYMTKMFHFHVALGDQMNLSMAGPEQVECDDLYELCEEVARRVRYKLRHKDPKRNIPKLITAEPDDASEDYFEIHDEPEDNLMED